VLIDASAVPERFFIIFVGIAKFMTALSLLFNAKYSIYKFLCQQNIFMFFIFIKTLF